MGAENYPDVLVIREDLYTDYWLLISRNVFEKSA